MSTCVYIYVYIYMPPHDYAGITGSLCILVGLRWCYRQNVEDEVTSRRTTLGLLVVLWTNNDCVRGIGSAVVPYWRVEAMLGLPVALSR